ncbi:2,3-diaminopropionate biosynthesis protein SbnB [Streptomyces varsoviensis]|uniref:2,3-diaminopropionate biosynthesis protein SbnB n=1 Tax=Streptomyces varsoviensis TaxID=67373 RepID=UPI0033C47037
MDTHTPSPSTPPPSDPVTACARPSPTIQDCDTLAPEPAPRQPLPALGILTGADVLNRLEGRREECVDVVRRAYLCHAAGHSVNPESAFLRFPERPEARIISLPAYLGGEFEVAGIKWVASFPGNPSRGIPRASAILLLNDTETGYPFAALEASLVSASRTAASAVLAAELLTGGRRAARIGIIGTGLIAGHVWRFLRDLRWETDGFTVFDLRREHAERFAGSLAADGAGRPAVAETAAEVLSTSDLAVITTVAGEPHIADPGLLAHGPTVLHLSLRDLDPAMILAAQNFTDDTAHAVRERTSLHLTEQRVGHREFIDGTLADLLRGTVARTPGRAAVFSPFGLGVLDLAVGRWVWEGATAAGAGRVLPDFYGDAVRDGTV